MKKNQLRELKTKTMDELKKDLSNLETDLDKMYLEYTQGTLVNTAGLNSKKRDIARVLTIMRIKELMERNEVVESKTEEKNE